MNQHEMPNHPTPLSMVQLQSALAGRWTACIQELSDGMVGGFYSPIRRADLVLEALATGAARWAAEPHGILTDIDTDDLLPPSQGPSEPALDPTANMVVQDMAGMFQRACQSIGEGANADGAVQAVFVPLQLSALRFGAALAFDVLGMRDAVLTTLDCCLREQLPTGITWLGD